VLPEFVKLARQVLYLNENIAMMIKRAFNIRGIDIINGIRTLPS
jgi:hypothetical protein